MPNNSSNLILNPVPLPLSGGAAETVFRDFETSVLDTYHTTLPLWAIDPNRAFYACLLAVDSMAVVMAVGSGHADSVGVWQYFKALGDGCSIAVRWLYPRITPATMGFVATEEEVSFAGRFLQHATDYAQLEVFHVDFAKGMYAVTADKDNRIVRFERNPMAKGNAYLHFGDLIYTHQQSITSDVPTEALIRLSEGVQAAKFERDRGRIRYSSVLRFLSPDVVKYCSELRTAEMVDLDPQASMGAFSAGEFSAYWDVLSSWSMCAVRGYLEACQTGVPQRDCMPTQVVPEKDYLGAMAKLTGFSDELVKRITSFLVYDKRTKHPDIFLQPLFALNGHFVWSPLIVSLSRQPRNALKLLCRTKATQKLGATLNGTRERGMLLRFGRHLQQRAGYDFKLNVTVEEGPDKTEIDLLAYNKKEPSQILLVQGKASIAADDQNEIDSVTQDMLIGQGQCQMAEAILKRLSVKVRSQLYKFVAWDKVTDYCPLVITPDSEPHGQYDHSYAPAIAMSSFEARVHDRKLRSPRSIWDTCRARSWESKQAHLKLSFMPFQVGDVAYHIPFMVDPDRVE